MKDNLPYFSHDNSSHDDPKIIDLFMKHGSKGYGIYWLLLEFMAQDPKCRIDQKYLEHIAFRFHEEIKDIKSIVNFCIEEDLFKKEENNYIFSKRLRKSKERVINERVRKSKGGVKGNEIRWGEHRGIANQSHTDSTPIATQSVPIANKSKGKESKGKKSIYLEFVKLTQKEHLSLTDRFGKSVTEDLIERLNGYIGSKGEKYKSHYHTILNWAKKDGITKPKKLDDKL